MAGKLRGMLAVAAAIAMGPACTETFPFGPGDVVRIRVSPGSLDLRVGAQVQLLAAALDSTGALLQGYSIVWTTSAPSVATVDAQGVLTGLAPGPATITAEAGGVQGTATITVDLPPAIGVSRDSVPFTATAGQNAPPDSVTVVNAGGFALAGLDLGTISYGPGAQGWLSATLSGSTAPATVVLTPAAASVTTAGAYRATVPITSTDAANSPRAVEVRLTIAPAPPGDPAISVDNAAIVADNAGAQPNTRAVVSVTLTDAFGNPRPGDIVTFGPSGATDFWRVSTTDATASTTDTTDAAGVAQRVFFSTRAEPKTLVATVPGGGMKTIGVVVSAAAPVAMAMVSGNGQTGIVGSPLPMDPTVRITDAFGNPVNGVGVTFSVTGGGGGVSGGSQTTNASGMAAVTAWTLGDGAAMSATGTFANALQAASGGLTPVAFTGTGIYSYATHVQPIWAGCLGCHGGLGGLSLAAPSHGALVDVNGVCNAAWKRVATGGGVAAESNSMLMRRLDNTAGGIPNCTSPMPGATLLPAASRDVVRAWIRNGAPNN